VGVRGSQRTFDHVDHTVHVPQHVVVPEPQQPKPSTAQEGVSPLVRARITVLPTIDLHDQSAFEADEIDHERPDGALATELLPCQLTLSNNRPELAFGICHFAS
jgi:hypothetical protein